MRAGPSLRRGVRATAMPISPAFCFVTTSKSYKISTWSATKPNGQSTARLTAPLREFEDDLVHGRAQPILPGTAHALIRERPPFLRQSEPAGHQVRRLSQLQLVRITGGERGFGKAVSREDDVGLRSRLAPELRPRADYGIG